MIIVHYCFFSCHCVPDLHQWAANYVTIAHFILTASVIVVVFISVLIFFCTSDEWKQKRAQIRHHLEQERRRKEEAKAAEKQKKIDAGLKKESLRKRKEAEKLKLRLAELEKFELSAPLSLPEDIELA